MSNKRLSSEEVRGALALRSTNQKNFEINKKSQALKVRKALTAKMWKEKEDSLSKLITKFRHRRDDW